MRYCDLGKIMGLGNEDMPTIDCDRVSSHDQSARTARSVPRKGWRHEVTPDLGSPLNYYKKGLNRLLELIRHKRMRRLLLAHKDRLPRFDSELVFAPCKIQNIAE
jgi:predicted site-specific integrase-resolvase